MVKPNVTTSLPKELYQFFWDVDPKKVNPAEKPYYVINRLLDKGNLEAARWVLRHFLKETIVASPRAGPAVDPPTAAFWSNYLHIPRKNIATNKQYKPTVDPNLWPYGDLN